VLAKTKDPVNIIPFMPRIFGSISDLTFDDGKIMTFKGITQEEIKLNKTVNPNDGENKGNVEKWLKDLEVKVKKTLREITGDCVKQIPENCENISWLNV